MNLREVNEGHFGVTVTLSQRNLVDLLAQLQSKGAGALHRMTDNGYLVVVAESDAAHYGDRTPGPGGLR